MSVRSLNDGRVNGRDQGQDRGAVHPGGPGPGRRAGVPGRPGEARRLGYDANEIDALPPRATESFAGVGNPLALARRAGEVVLDLGCGAGMDSLLAARRVGSSGWVIGVDMTGPMLEKARANALEAGVGNVEFRRGEADRLPVGDETVDVLISNGVFNLCRDKPRVLAEVFRVLRPGGRLQIADILLNDAVTPEEVEAQGDVVGLNRRGGLGAVAPGDVDRHRVRRNPRSTAGRATSTSSDTQGGLITARSRALAMRRRPKPAKNTSVASGSSDPGRPGPPGASGGVRRSPARSSSTPRSRPCCCPATSRSRPGRAAAAWAGSRTCRWPARW